MKYLEAQRLAAEAKAADPHANKMMNQPPNKSQQPPNTSGKNRPSTPVTKPNATDDAIALSRSLGIDLASVKGTGHNGQILPVDVRKVSEEKDKTHHSGASQ